MLKPIERFFFSEKVIMIAIGFTAIILFILSFPIVKNAHPDSWCYSIHIIDNFLIIFFLAEALVKIKTLGWKGYFKSGWNKLDFGIVLISLPAIIPTALISFLPITVSKASSFLMFRLLRLVRLMRFLEFIPHLKQLIVGLGRAFRASIFVLGVLITLNVVLAIISCHLFDRSSLFPDPMTACYTIFQLFTLEGWNEIPTKVIADLKVIDTTWKVIAIRFYFVVLVLMGGIFGLSIANAVFVDEMTIDNNIKLEEKIDSLEKQIAELSDFLKNKS